MKDTGCNDRLLRLYLSDSLTLDECRRFEKHAVSCEFCSKRIEEELIDAAQAIRRAFPLVNPSSDLLKKVYNEQRDNRKETAESGLRQLIRRTGSASRQHPNSKCKITIESTEGGVLCEDRTLSAGDEIPIGSPAIAIGRTRIRFGLIVMSCARGWNDFIFRVINGTLTISTSTGASFSGPSQRSPYMIHCGGAQIEPRGTRFAVSANAGDLPTVEIYAHLVFLSGTSMDGAHSEGKAIRRGIEEKVLFDDPSVLDGKEPYLPRMLRDAHTASPEQPAVPNVFASLKELSSKILQGGNDVSLYCRLIDELGLAGDVASIRGAISSLVAVNPSLSMLKPDQVLSLFRQWRNDPELIKDLELVASRCSAQIRGHSHLSAWRAFIEAEGSAAKQACLDLAQFGETSDSFAIASRLISHSIWIHYDMEAFRLAEELLSQAIPLARSDCNKAEMLAALAEAQYYQLSKRQQSLSTLRKSLDLWPKPFTKVNYATRVAEESDITPDDLRLCAEGILQHPSAYSYERAMKLVGCCSKSESDWQDLYDLCRWVGKTYWNVAATCVTVAVMMLFRHPKEARVFMSRAISLYGGSPTDLPAYQWHYWAYIRWMTETDAARSDFASGERIARECGLIDLNQRSGSRPLSSDFYARIGDYKRALDRLALEDEHGEQLRFRGRYLKRLGKKEEALKCFEEAMRNGEDGGSEYERFWMLVNIAECCMPNDPDRAITMAKALLDELAKEEFCGALKVQNRSIYLQARVCWILGQRQKAVDLLSSCLNDWYGIEDFEMLNAWKASLE